MKMYNLTEKQKQAIGVVRSLGYKCEWWGPNSEATRIYFKTQRYIKCWIEFDDADECEGAALKVYIQDCGQHANWYQSQRQRVLAHFVNAFQAVTGQIRTEQQPNVVTEDVAESLKIGQVVEYLTGGQPGESNDERSISGPVIDVVRQPAPSGTIGQKEQVSVRIATATGDIELYTWRGILRYGSGAQIVRRPLN